jgi:hypothetical protein
MNGLGAALLADGPHASLGEQAHVVDRFLGVWDCPEDSPRGGSMRIRIVTDFMTDPGKTGVGHREAEVRASR